MEFRVRKAGTEILEKNLFLRMLDQFFCGLIGGHNWSTGIKEVNSRPIYFMRCSRCKLRKWQR